MRLVVSNVKFPLNHLGYASARPDLAAKTVCFSPMAQQIGQSQQIGRS
jgi:hypothetical protein